MVQQCFFCARLGTGLLAFTGRRHKICSQSIHCTGVIIKQSNNFKNRKPHRHQPEVPRRGYTVTPGCLPHSSQNVSLKPNVKGSAQPAQDRPLPNLTLLPPIGPTATHLTHAPFPIRLHWTFGSFPKQHSQGLTTCQKRRF